MLGRQVLDGNLPESDPFNDIARARHHPAIGRYNLGQCNAALSNADGLWHRVANRIDCLKDVCANDWAMIARLADVHCLPGMFAMECLCIVRGDTYDGVPPCFENPFPKTMRHLHTPTGSSTSREQYALSEKKLHDQLTQWICLNGISAPAQQRTALLTWDQSFDHAQQI